MEITGFFRDIGKQARDILKEIDNPTEIVGMNPLGQHTMRVDQVLEDMVIERLNDSKLGNFLVTEERGEVGLEGGTLTFVMDPLDGSNNFRRRVPFYGLAISAAKGRDYNDITHSYIIDLANGDEFWAVRGKGSFMNGDEIHTSTTTNLEKCIVEYDCNLLDQYDLILPAIRKFKDHRRFGANAVALCHIANGAHHCFIDIRDGLSIVHAAGMKIAEEAGAVITDDRGNPLTLTLSKDTKLNFVCSANKDIHEKVLGLLGVG
ncbi:MAG: hypothetical protein KKB24_04290 [Candidatus Altiarchaeota archaeon]|nr:hypothetical protein [Candidatus Altiarchaeota archaeon]